MAHERIARAMMDRDAVLVRARSGTQRGLFRECGFCGREGGPFVSGPLTGICEQCVQFAAGMYLVAFRDGLSIGRDFDAVWRRAVSEYTLAFGERPITQRPTFAAVPT
jgi:hypothetical protein